MGNLYNINNSWKFFLGDEPNADYMGFDDCAWQDVTIPHDWSVAHPFSKSNASGTGYVCGGTAWYRKHFTLPDDIKGKRVRITFDGVYKHSRVWINSNYLGGRAYGYAIASIFFLHFTINIGMVLGLVPVIGIPLPFFSYGGSSFLGFTILLFIFLRIDADRDTKK